MEKVSSPKRQDGLYKVGLNKWELVYGFGKDKETDETGWNWRHRFVGEKPTEDECRQVIIDQINAETQQRILEGFSWKGIPVWLSQENQMNFGRIERCGADYPLTMKLGEEESEPVYYEFQSPEEFGVFSRAYSEYIMKCLQEGWKEKDKVYNLDDFYNSDKV